MSSERQSSSLVQTFFIKLRVNKWAQCFRYRTCSTSHPLSMLFPIPHSSACNHHQVLLHTTYISNKKRRATRQSILPGKQEPEFEEVVYFFLMLMMLVGKSCQIPHHGLTIWEREREREEGTDSDVKIIHQPHTSSNIRLPTLRLESFFRLVCTGL